MALIVFNLEKAEKEYIQMNRDLIETIEIYLCAVVIWITKLLLRKFILWCNYYYPIGFIRNRFTIHYKRFEVIGITIIITPMITL